MKLKRFRVGFLLFIGAQSLSTTILADNQYISAVDRSLTFRTISIVESTDNVNGIFSRPVESRLTQLIEANHRFDFKRVSNIDIVAFRDESQRVSQLTDLKLKSGIDLALTANVYKNVQNFEINLTLYSCRDGRVLGLENNIADLNSSTSQIETLSAAAYQRLLSKIPYRGLVLSREGNRITMNLGTSDGIKKDDILDIEQITSVKRHPKFDFITDTNKEILGHIKVIKADETLSFGVVVEERARGAIQVDSKVGGIGFISYNDGSERVTDLTGGAVRFSKQKGDIIPAKQPSYGRVGFGLGLGSYHAAETLQTSGSLSGDASLFPQLQLTAELWLTPHWIVSTEIRQGLLSPLGNGSGNAGNVETHTSVYDVAGGYRFLLQDEVFGPQIDVHGGFTIYNMTLLQSTAFPYQTTTYRGFYIGVGGMVPISTDHQWLADAKFNKYFSPSLDEAPYSSGSASDSSITTLSFGLNYRLFTSIWLAMHLNYETYFTNFSGQGTFTDAGINASQNMFSLLTSAQYYF